MWIKKYLKLIKEAKNNKEIKALINKIYEGGFLNGYDSIGSLY